MKPTNPTVSRLMRTKNARRQARSHICDLLTIWGKDIPINAVRGLESMLCIQPGTLVDAASKLRLLRDEGSEQFSLRQIDRRFPEVIEDLGAWRKVLESKQSST